MKVYVLIEYIGGDYDWYTELVGVFGTRRKAEEWDSLHKLRGDISEMEINNPDYKEQNNGT